MGHRLRRLVTVSLMLWVVAGASRAEASGFVYAAVPAAACAAASPCAPPELLVLDADTSLIVLRLPLPVHTVPAGLAISPDGRHLYVSNRATEFDGVTSMTVIDARRHAIVGTFPTGANVAGPLAVRANDSQVFLNVFFPPLQSATILGIFDTASHAVTLPVMPPPASGLPAIRIATHPSLDRLYVGTGTCLFFTTCPGTLEAFDAGTLASLVQVSVPRGVFDLRLSDSGKRVHVGAAGATSPTRLPQRIVFDPETLAELSNNPTSFSLAPAEIGDTGDVLVFGFDLSGLLLLRLGQSPAQIPLSTEVLINPRVVVAADGTRAFVSLNETAGPSLMTVDLAAPRVVSTLRTTQQPTLVTSRPGVPVCRYGLDTAFSSYPTSGGSGSVRLSTDCAWEASSDATWARISVASGSGTATIGVTVDPNVLPSPRTARLTIAGQRVIVTQAGAVSQPPFGVFDTPADGTSGSTGSLAVTGWAMDDVGVARVKIFRDAVAGEAPGLVFIGDASLVEGARPDVQAVFPNAPFNTRAGWGYLLLTNVLPGSGNGTFRLSAFAEDVEGNSSLLGTKTVTVTNSTATLPFGTIDTPGQGELVSGTIVNFGWALTPQPATIALDGSGIDVIVDGVNVGHPTYNQPRSDIATLFPGYTNTPGPVGFFMIDTLTLTNGVHTIAWVVRDSLGRAAGIGSRFFGVFNASASVTAEPIAGDPGAGPGQARPLRSGDDAIGGATVAVARGVATEPMAEGMPGASRIATPPVEGATLAVARSVVTDPISVGMPGRSPAPVASWVGADVIRVRVGGRIDVDLSGNGSGPCSASYGGLLAGEDAPRPLPPGATIDRTGHFRWEPSTEQTGSYEIVLTRTLCETLSERRLLQVVVSR